MSKKELKLKVSLLLLFSIIFIAAIISLKRGLALFGIGIEYKIEDYIVILLSFISIVRLFVSIIFH